MLIRTAAIARPASPIFKSLRENFSDVSSELFIFKSPAFRQEPGFGPEWKQKAASIERKIQELMWVSLGQNLFNSRLTDKKSPLISCNSIKSGGGTGPMMPRQPVRRKSDDQVPIPGPEKPDKDGESALK